MRADHYRFVIIDKTNFDESCETWLGSARNQSVFTPGKKRPQPAPPDCGLPLHNRGNCRGPQLLGDNHYRIVIIGKRFLARPSDAASVVQLKEQPREVVELKSLPASVQTNN